MHRLFGSNRICSGSGSSLAFSIMIVFVLVIAPPARAQGKPDSGSASCVPSDLSSSITQEGRTVQVMQAAEESGRKGNGHASAVVSSSGDVADRLDAEQRKDAYKIFLREAQRGNPAAMVNLGVASLAGWGTEVNAGTALYWLHLAADSGYDPAFYNLGILYFKGCGVPRDAAEAFHFFDLGARSGNAAAQVNLGYFYDHGLGMARDYAAAAFWYRKAAEFGLAQAQYNLADLCLRGEGVAKDEAAAFAWFQKAAQQGHTGAQIMAGSMLAAGRGTSKDLARAYLWLFAATLRGDDRGVITLRTVEGQLTSEQIEQAKAHAKSFRSALEARSDVALLH